MFNYYKKYLKYKEKYLKLKNLIGGSEDCRMIGNPAFPSPVYSESKSYSMDCDTRSIEVTYLDSSSNKTELFKRLDELESLEKIPILILKIGSNDTTAEGGVGEDVKVKMHTSSGFLDINPRWILKVLRNKYSIISIAPENPSEKTKIREIDEDSDNMILEPLVIKGCFPLATGNDEANSILSKIISYKGNLVILNAMGSACYRSIKAILDNRTNINTNYLTYVNIHGQASCNNTKIYDSEENYNKCIGTYSYPSKYIPLKKIE